MSGIVWLASYPKSGNTWLRVLLTNYQRNSEIPADINRLNGGPIASARVWFDEWAGVEASALSVETVDRLRADVYRCIADEATSQVWMKVHDAWRSIDGEAMFPMDVTDAVIYVVRNPLDIAASAANHYGISIAEAVDLLCDQRANYVQRAKRTLPEQLPQWVGSWGQHVESWVDDSQLPVHVVRYEDLRSHPVDTFGAVLAAMEIEVEPDRLVRAVEQSSFRELKRQESDAGFRERLGAASESFFRSGSSGGFREELTSDQIEQIMAAHHGIMSRFGYDGNRGPEVEGGSLTATR